MTATGATVEGRSNLPSVPNFFSSDPFFEAVANVFYPGRRWQAEYVEVGGRIYRVLVVGRTIVDELWAQPFYFEPVLDGKTLPHRQIAYLPQVSHGRVSYEEVATHGISSGYRPSPFIDWSDFPAWGDYERSVLQSRTLAFFRTGRQRYRAASRRLGALEFQPRDDDPAVIDLAMRWKSAQLGRTGLPDWFADPRTRQLYDELGRMGLLTTSTLRAGPRLLAVLAGTTWEGRYFARLSSYDFDLATYSPGRLLIYHALEWSYREGHREFDFLRGGEQYKWGFATHARLLAPVGAPPRSRMALEKSRAAIGSQLVRWPRLLERARKLEAVMRGRPRGM